jgi:hypothetical protein
VNVRLGLLLFLSSTWIYTIRKVDADTAVDATHSYSAVNCTPGNFVQQQLPLEITRNDSNQNGRREVIEYHTKAPWQQPTNMTEILTPPLKRGGVGIRTVTETTTTTILRRPSIVVVTNNNQEVFQNPTSPLLQGC